MTTNKTSEKAKDELIVICPCCRGDGKDTCHNPDHGFLNTLAWGDTARLGCPLCGHDPQHKIKSGGACEDCKGTGKIKRSEAIIFCNEHDYDYEELYDDILED